MKWFDLIPSFIQAIGAVTAAIVSALVGYRLARHQGESYERRTDSDEDWFHDIIRSKEIVFLGISHTSLKVYLDQILNHKPRSSKLRSIKVIYASTEDGKVWEDASFLDNMRQSRQKVAALLCSTVWCQTFSYFQSVSFLQSKHAIGFGGSAMIGNENMWRTIYVVHYLPTQTSDAKKTITLRYSSSLSHYFSRRTHNLMAVWGAAYRDVLDKAADLGVFRHSLWDESVQEWSEFSRSCQAHQNSMRHLLKFASLKGRESILDLASGTGDTSRLIVEQHHDISLTVLDASPRMIEKCRSVLGAGAEYALAQIPPPGGKVLVDLDGKSFDVILIHLAVPAVAANVDALSAMARWCRDYLKPGGRIFLAVHNTAVSIVSSGFSIEQDTLRDAIKSELERMGLPHAYRQLARNRFSPEDIESAFAIAGFRCARKDQASFEMTMKDRLVLWSAPAVLNDVVDLTALETEQVTVLLQNLRTVLSNRRTADMAVLYWSFVCPPTNAPRETRENEA